MPMKKINYPVDKVIAFMVAVEESDVDAMRRFFSEEPDMFRKLRQDNTWIICDAARESTPQGVRALLDLGADINQQDYRGFTGLCCAVAGDRYEMANFFLECGADVNLGSPLFNVASQNLQARVAMARLLLDHGA